MKNKVLILIAIIFGLAAFGEGLYIAAKKIEKYEDKIIFQEIALEKTASILSVQQGELEKIKEELNIAQKGLDKKN